MFGSGSGSFSRADEINHSDATPLPERVVDTVGSQEQLPRTVETKELDEITSHFSSNPIPPDLEQWFKIEGAHPKAQNPKTRWGRLFEILAQRNDRGESVMKYAEIFPAFRIWLVNKSKAAQTHSQCQATLQ